MEGHDPECDEAVDAVDSATLRRAARSGDGLAQWAVRVEQEMDRRRARGPDYAWGLLMVAAAVLLVLSVTDALWRGILRGDWSHVLSVPFGLLFWYWIGMGSWRRTRWGAPRPR
jgi:hypothetical protein